jgi:hypothetical protein
VVGAAVEFGIAPAEFGGVIVARKIWEKWWYVVRREGPPKKGGLVAQCPRGVW